MMGKDLDRINTVLNKLKDEIAKQIHLLARESDHRLETIDHSHNTHVINGGHGDGHGIPQEHVHMVHGIDYPTGWVGNDGEGSRQLTYIEEYSDDRHMHHQHIMPKLIYERQHCVDAFTYVTPILNVRDEMWEDGKKMHKIEDDMYTEKETFNTTYGSPYKEIYILKDKLDEMERYAADYPTLQWLGEKHSLLALMNLCLTYTVDAKWACVVNHDFIQRGYDADFNEQNPSITWDAFDKETIGNVEQYIEDAVNLNNALSLDSLKDFFGANLSLDKLKGFFDPF